MGFLPSSEEKARVGDLIAVPISLMMGYKEALRGVQSHKRCVNTSYNEKFQWL